MLIILLFQLLVFQSQDFSILESRYQEFCHKWQIPGLRVGIVADDTLVWSAGYGTIELDKSLLPQNSTPFRVASLSKPIAAILVMQLVENSELNLETAITELEIARPEGVDASASLVHLLSHTSHDAGGSFAYSGRIYDCLTEMLVKHYQMDYPEIIENILIQPLGLSDTSPGQYLAKHQPVNDRIPEPLIISGSGLLRAGEYVEENGSAAAGLVVSVNDLAKIDCALFSNTLLSEKMQNKMFESFQLKSGETSNYGLGWFIQQIQGETVGWHYGIWESAAGLWVRLPNRKLSLIALSNGANLSHPDFALWEGDVMKSPFAREFLTLVLQSKNQR